MGALVPANRAVSILMRELGIAGEMEQGIALGVMIVFFVMVVTFSARAIGLRMGRKAG